MKIQKKLHKVIAPYKDIVEDKFLTEQELDWLKKFHRLTNYIGVASLYLKENFLLKKPLCKKDIKDRILGHWGTVPGLNFIYANLNLLVSRHKQKTMLIIGPGHGAPAALASLFVEGTITDFYPDIPWNAHGMGKLIKSFSWPYSHFPSHVTPGVPGSILEGGELGYSLSTAFGAAMDNPDLLVAVVVGDGESESGPLAAAWHGNKFLNAKESGAVLPIVHVNGYKISGPSILATMSDSELQSYFHGLGYKPYFAVGKPEQLYSEMAETMELAYQEIKNIQYEARVRNCVIKVHWPMIIFRSIKGWTGGKKIEDNYRAHGIPLKEPKTNRVQFNDLNNWLKSYKVNDFFEKNGKLKKEILKYIPKGDLRIGKCKNTIGGNLVKDLPMPKLEAFSFNGKHGHVMGKNTQIAAEWLNKIFIIDRKKNNMFRYFCPDETDSNKMGKMFEGGGREYVWPVKIKDECIVTTGKIIEILSEHTLLGFLEGYILTGRHGFFATYEAFSMINVSMVDQFCKYIKQAKRIKWRKPIASLNYLNASLEWRQEHNGYSHQNPGLISTLTEKHGEFCSAYFPPDGNSLMVVFEQCFKSRDRVNLITAAKQTMPQWLTMKEARRQCEQGVMIWDWIDKVGARDPDIVFAAAGDYMVEECMAAIDILRHEIPELKMRFVCVSELSNKGFGNSKYLLNNDNLKEFEKYFTKDKPIIFSFHGYENVIKKLLFQNPAAFRFNVHGYREEGSTTTPFDMVVRNGLSRFHLILEALNKVHFKNTKVANKAKLVIKKYKKKLHGHNAYIMEHGQDYPDVVHWQWDKVTSNREK